jgi:hypothetical protein
MRTSVVTIEGFQSAELRFQIAVVCQSLGLLKYAISNLQPEIAVFVPTAQWSHSKTG